MTFLASVIMFLFMVPVSLLVMAGVWLANRRARNPRVVYGEVLARWTALHQPTWSLRSRMICHAIGWGLCLIVVGLTPADTENLMLAGAVLAGFLAGVALAVDLAMWLRKRLGHETILTDRAILAGDYICWLSEVEQVEDIQGTLTIQAKERLPFAAALAASPQGERLQQWAQQPKPAQGEANPLQWRRKLANVLLWGLVIASWGGAALPEHLLNVFAPIYLLAWLAAIAVWALERRVYLFVPIPFTPLAIPLTLRAKRWSRAAILGGSLAGMCLSLAFSAI